MGVLPAQTASIPEKRLHSEMSYKRLERGRFVWTTPTDGVVSITAAQLSYMLEGIDWRNPQRTWRPELAG